ncbi:MAG: exodeoxyribonuclease VII small subunit [Elusimicrobiota bacterium]|nr:exodeoxyribonuclease VII small subunit [Elusimicrobiota bacterium]
MSEQINFEDAIQELEDITSKLSEGSLELDKSIELFERGMELKKICSKYLGKAEAKIKKLVEKDGKYEEANMEDISDE